MAGGTWSPYVLVIYENGHLNRFFAWNIYRLFPLRVIHSHTVQNNVVHDSFKFILTRREWTETFSLVTFWLQNVLIIPSATVYSKFHAVKCGPLGDDFVSYDFMATAPWCFFSCFYPIRMQSPFILH